MSEKVLVKLVENSTDNLPLSDFIYNRCDRQKRESFLTFQVFENNKTCFIHGWYENNEGRLGVWNTPISKIAIKKIVKLMYSNNKRIKRVVIEFCLHKIGYTERNPHFEIQLSTNKEDLLQRMRGKHLRQVSSMKRKLASEFGEEKLLEYSISNCPDYIYDFYAENKRDTKGITISLSKDDYFKKYYVTDVYALTFGEKVVSVILSCEQCTITYLENLTYDLALAKYSPGKLLYIDYLCKLVEKGKNTLYLGGGNYEYKKQFDSIQTDTYYCVVPRSGIFVPYLKFKYFVKRLLGRD